MIKKVKKINLICLILLLALFSGCSNPSSNQPELSMEPTVVATPVPSPSPEPEKRDTPDVIGLFIHDRTAGRRRLVTEYQGDWVKGEDIKCFEAFATQEASLSVGQFGDAWRAYWNRYQDADLCKIGYCLYFTLTDGERITQIIKTPEDTEKYKMYIETYLYDDANQQPGVWYSHLEPEDMTDETICTSIKLTAGAEIDKVKEISLEAFVYTGSEAFDPETGSYIGTVSYKFPIKRA